MKRPTPQKAESSALNSVHFTVAVRFNGTNNPRYLRVIHVMMMHPLTREQLDQIAGCSNGPDLVAGLRRLGLEVPCTRTKKMTGICSTAGRVCITSRKQTAVG